MHGDDTGRLRRATKNDLAAARALTRDACAKWIPLIGREPMPMAVDYALAVHTHRFDLLEQGGEFVTHIETILHPDHPWIENLAASPRHHGEGLGTRMQERAEGVGRMLVTRRSGWPPTRHLPATPASACAGVFSVERTSPFREGIAVYRREVLQGFHAGGAGERRVPVAASCTRDGNSSRVAGRIAHRALGWHDRPRRHVTRKRHRHAHSLAKPAGRSHSGRP